MSTKATTLAFAPVPPVVPAHLAWRAGVRLAAFGVLALIGLALLAGHRISDMGAAYTASLFVVALCLPAWCCFRRSSADASGHVDLLQPGAVVAIWFYLYTVVPALHVWLELDYQSIWVDPTWPPQRVFHISLLLSLVGLAAFGIGYRSHDPRPIPTRSAAATAAPARWPVLATGTALIMLVVGFGFKLRHLVLLGGLTPSTFLYLSPTYVSESGIKTSGVFTFFESWFDWGALLLLFWALTTGRRRFLAVAVIILAFVLAYLLSGKRSAIIPFILYPLTWLHYLKRRVSVRRGLLYGGATVALVTFLLFMRTLGPLFATKGVDLSSVPADIALEPAKFYLNSPELAMFDMTMLAVEDREPLLHTINGPFWGGLKYNFAPAAYIIPRFLWPGKPTFTDLGQVFFQRAVGEREDVGFTVGIVGALYLFGGLVGVFVGMLIVGWLFRWVYERIRPWNRSLASVFVYGILLWILFLFLRFGALGFTILFALQFELAGVIVALVVLQATRAHSLTPNRP